MVSRVLDRSGFADGVEHDVVVLATRRDAIHDDVRQRHVRGRERGLGDGLSGFGLLDLFGQFLGAREQGRPVIGGGGTHLLAGRLLLGTQVVGGGDHGAPRGIGVQQRVDEGRVLAARPLRRAHPIRVFT
jgi:hypothetical protein